METNMETGNDIQIKSGKSSSNIGTACLVDEDSELSRQNIEQLIYALRSKKVFPVKDESGKLRLQYPDEVNTPATKNNRNRLDMTHCNLIANSKTKDRELENVEAFLELVTNMKENKYPSGICFDNTKVSTAFGKYTEGKDFEKTKKVLGRGNMAGDVIVVRDHKKGQENALKTVMISVFRKEEIKMWIDLNEEDFVPRLLLVRTVDNTIEFHMEKLDNVVSLREVIDEHMQKIDSKDVRSVSLCILHNLLTTVNKIHDKNWTHRDLHAGNAMLQLQQGSVDMKIIDFGLGGLKNSPDGPAGFRNDLMQCFRIFSALYLGQEFDGLDDVIKNGESKLNEMCELYQLDEMSRKEILQLFDIFLQVIDYGDSKPVIEHVEGMITKHGINKNEVLQYVAQKLFPDMMDTEMKEVEEEDSVDCQGSQGERFDSGASTGSIISLKFIEEVLDEISLNRDL